MATSLVQHMIWIPFERVGELPLGMPFDAAAYGGEIVHILDEEGDVVGWQVYGDLAGTLRVYLDGGLICSVGCYGSCEYSGKETIGMRIADLLSLMDYPPGLKEDDIVETADGPEKVYELESVGAQVWVRGGQVVTVVCIPRQGAQKTEE